MIRIPQKHTTNTRLDACDMEEFNRCIAPQISLYKKRTLYSRIPTSRGCSH